MPTMPGFMEMLIEPHPEPGPLGLLLLLVLFLCGIAAVIGYIVVLIAVWRGMKAQEVLAASARLAVGEMKRENDVLDGQGLQTGFSGQDACRAIN